MSCITTAEPLETFSLNVVKPICWLPLGYAPEIAKVVLDKIKPRSPSSAKVTTFSVSVPGKNCLDILLLKTFWTLKLKDSSEVLNDVCVGPTSVKSLGILFILSP